MELQEQRLEGGKGDTPTREGRQRSRCSDTMEPLEARHEPVQSCVCILGCKLLKAGWKLTGPSSLQ